MPASANQTRPREGAKLQCFFVRRRTFFTLVVPLLLVALAKPKAAWLPWGAALVLAGEVVRIWAAGYLVKGKELTTSGPFGRLRHPLYLGSLLIATGYCFMSGLWASFPVVWALYALFFLSAMLYEERILEEAFGDEYHRYRARTHRLWPTLTPYPSPPGRFSSDRVRANREPRVALSVLATLALFLVRWVLVR